MFGPQPARPEAAAAPEPITLTTRVGHLRPPAGSAEFHDGRRWVATPGGVCAEAALLAATEFGDIRQQFAAPGGIPADATFAAAPGFSENGTRFVAPGGIPTAPTNAKFPAAPRFSESRRCFATSGGVPADAKFPAAPRFSENHRRQATALPWTDSPPVARSGDAWGLQRIGPRAAPAPVERSAGHYSATVPRRPEEDRATPPVERSAEHYSAADLTSRRPVAVIEAMLRQLLADDRILAARKLADAVPPDLAAGESLRCLLEVLAPPVVLRRTPARAGGADDIEWLRRHAGAHAGKWVALAGGKLLATDESLAALRRRLREIAPHADPLLHQM